ncbi:MAG TPA: type II toxin-antitoxin system VapC family toxin [Tepidisphaeraceae bacterium]|nr:type II toxin-antitoxin system VapC family toxin [Tepidisphaeraceae bacterium]
MRVLLDTHTLIWAVSDPTRLGSAAVAALNEPTNELLTSAGTIWEIAIKVGLNKLTLSLPFRQWVNQAITDLSLSVLPITVNYADVQVGLPFHHRDPFDRLLVAQAIMENVPVVTADSMFDAYGVKRIWD